MSGGTAQLQAALRGSSLSLPSAATFIDAFTGLSTPLSIEGGEVVVDVAATCRRTLNLTLPPSQTVFDTLASPGGEIACSQTARFIDNTFLAVPLGVFRVDDEAMTYAPGGNITLACPDRWSVIVANGFDNNRASIPSNTIWQEIKRLVEGAWANAGWPFPGWASLDTSATAKVGPVLWADGNRAAAIAKLLADNVLDCYFDVNGLAVLRPRPQLTNKLPAVYTITDGDNGVLLDANRARSTTDVRNVVVVQTSASDVILPMQVVANTRDYTTDPLSSLGPLGRRTAELAGNYRTVAQMVAAGKAELNRLLTVQQRLDVTITANPCLDAYDLIDVVLPKGDLDAARPLERHIIDRVNVPLVPSGTQTITTRAARSSADDTIPA